MALRRSVGNLAAGLLSMASTRLELFALEASEQKSRLLVTLALGCGVVIFATLALVVFSVGVMLYYWPSGYRYVAMFVLALLYALTAVVLVLLIRRRLVRGGMPFAATLEELRQDVLLVERLRGAHDEDADAPLFRDGS